MRSEQLSPVHDVVVGSPYALCAGLIYWGDGEMRRSYTRGQLINWGFERHGIGIVLGYGDDGLVGSWALRCSANVVRLPEGLAYVWK